VNPIEQLKAVIRQLHKAEPSHVESVPVKEVFQGQTVWDGIVEVFDLGGHPEAPRVYAWSHETDTPLKRLVSVLHIPPVVSPLTAVRAAILEEYNGAQQA
jgi:hypothetical protein